MERKDNRNKIIIRTGIIGIIANVILAVFKAVIGMAANSIAIVMDAVNNLSDAASSVITIVGTKLAGKDADRKHPFGYGRVEYLSEMLISMLVLYAGITAFTESVKKIIKPVKPEYGSAMLIIIAVAVVVKIVLGLYVKGTGKKVNSDSLVNSGQDALLDSVISITTLISAGIYIIFDISTEAWLGAIIAVVIIKSGFDMLKETVSKILGERAEVSLVKDIKATIKSFPGISGAYDLVLHNYGPDMYNGSVHIEVPENLRADELDRLERKITMEVHSKHNVLLTAIGVYSYNTSDERAVQIRDNVNELVTKDEYVLSMHGFYIDEEEKKMRFDIVVSFDAPDRGKVYEEAHEIIGNAYPEYDIYISMDADFS